MAPLGPRTCVLRRLWHGTNQELGVSPDPPPGEACQTAGAHPEELQIEGTVKTQGSLANQSPPLFPGMEKAWRCNGSVELPCFIHLFAK